MKNGVWKIWWLCISLCPALLGAQTPNTEETDRIWAEARAAAQTGPAQIALKSLDTLQATLALPADQLFVPQPYASQVLRAMGNTEKDEQLLGLVFPTGDAPWLAALRFQRAGYVDDEDVRNWDTADMLERYKKSLASAQAAKVKAGSPAVDILGWARQPAYDIVNHRLSWALSSRDHGAPTTDTPSVNYNAVSLVRDGYFSINVVTDLASLPTYQAVVQGLVEALHIPDGRRYADHNTTIDKTADHDLAALVVGAEPKKRRIRALLLQWWSKYWMFLAAAVAVAIAVTRFWRKRQQTILASYAYANTRLVEPDSPDRTLPQPLAPHPHANQVSSGRDGNADSDAAAPTR